MIIRYLSHQDKSDPLNGQIISGSPKLTELLNDRRNQPPFIAELSGDNGFQIVFGMGFDVACVEHSRIDGDLPYLMAVSREPRMKTGEMEFLAANTPTPIAARYILSFDELKEIALHFLTTGDRSNAVSWEPI